MEAPYQYPSEPQAPSAEPRYQYPAQSADPSIGMPYEHPSQPPASSTETPYQYPNEPQAPSAEPQYGYTAQSAEPSTQATYGIPAEPPIEQAQSQIPPQPVATPPPAAVSSAPPRSTITHAPVPASVWLFGGITAFLLILSAIPATPWFTWTFRGEPTDYSLWGGIDLAEGFGSGSGLFSVDVMWEPAFTAYALVWIAVALTLGAMVSQHSHIAANAEAFKNRSEKIFGLAVLGCGFGMFSMLFVVLYVIFGLTIYIDPALGVWLCVLATLSLIGCFISIVKYANDIQLFDKIDPPSILGFEGLRGRIGLATFWLLTAVVFPILLASFISHIWILIIKVYLWLRDLIDYDIDWLFEPFLEVAAFAETGSTAPIQVIHILLYLVFEPDYLSDAGYIVPAGMLFVVILLLWSVAGVRRFHDRGFSGFWILASVIPLVFFIEGWFPGRFPGPVSWVFSAIRDAPDVVDLAIGFVLFVAFVWSVIELGFRGSSPETNSAAANAIGQQAGYQSSVASSESTTGYTEVYKNCLYCAETIRYEATRCPHCQSDLGTSSTNSQV